MAITTYRRSSTAREERSIILASLIAICYGVGLQGSIAQDQGRNLFLDLPQPAWMPADWLSGVIGTVVYALMAVCAWLVWTERDQLVEEKRFALACFIGQLALNGLLPWALFVWRVPSIALALLLLNVAAVQYTGAVFYRTRRLAGWLWLPCILWSCFMLIAVVAIL